VGSKVQGPFSKFKTMEVMGHVRITGVVVFMSFGVFDDVLGPLISLNILDGG
jgi:hypothetical protein